MKRPSFQFYPGDWLKDPKLRIADWEIRGLWIDLMCYMHNDAHYGYLCIGDQFLDQNAIQRLLNANPKRFHRVFNSLKTIGIIAVDDRGFYSKRMVEDERVRRVRAESGSRGGNPNLVNQKVNQNFKQNLTPSSSSSTSSSKKSYPKKAAPPALSDRFSDFWREYPKKVARSKCEDKWKALKLDGMADSIIESVRKYKQTRQWIEGGVRYIPNPETFLNQKRWNDEVPEDKTYNQLGLTKPTVVQDSRLVAWKSGRRLRHIPSGMIINPSEITPFNHRSNKATEINPTGFKSVKTGHYDFFKDFELAQ